ncbi:MAG: CSLREA domain-containing protein, partial [Chloroflexi bacterium]
MIKRIVILPAIILLLGAVILDVIQPAAADSTIIVNTTSDNIVSDSNCSLREAIIAANTNSAYNGCAAGSGTDTIEFAPSLPQPFTILLTITGKNEDSSMSGDLDITDDLIVVGAGETNSILDGNNSDRIFEVHSGNRLTISGLTMQNGNPGAGVDGGGVLVKGQLTVSDSRIQSNQGSGISNDGGIAAFTNVRVQNNSGYGVRNHSVATLTYEGGEVNDNGGGGIYNAAATATLTSLTISKNTHG